MWGSLLNVRFFVVVFLNYSGFLARCLGVGSDQSASVLKMLSIMLTNIIILFPFTLCLSY